MFRFHDARKERYWPVLEPKCVDVCYSHQNELRA